MARGKVQIRRIENSVHRQITFCKRRSGLLKKGNELSVLCDADIGIIIFSDHGKCYELATKGTMQEMAERYLNTLPHQMPMTKPKDALLEQEIAMLRQEIDLLQNTIRRNPFPFGEDIGNMTMDQLISLEKHLDMWMSHIRTSKTKIMFEEIQLLKHKESTLKATNKILQEDFNHYTTVFEDAFVCQDQIATNPNIGYLNPYEELAINDEIFQFEDGSGWLF